MRTGSALAENGIDALYAHTGVIQVPTVTAMIDTARTLSTQPLMTGRRVAIVSNSRSPTVLATASLTSVGIEVVDPPFELTWRSTSDDYARAVAAAVTDDGIDAVMVIHAPPLVEAIGEPTETIDNAAAGSDKPIVAVMLGSGNGPLRPWLPHPVVPVPRAGGIRARPDRRLLGLAPERPRRSRPNRIRSPATSTSPRRPR